MKLGVSRVRSLFELIPQAAGKGQHYAARLKGVGDVGMMRLSPEGAVSYSHIDPAYRGMGLGKKMYGEAMRRQPQQTLQSDQTVSDAAKRIWESFSKSPSYTTTTAEAPIQIGGMSFLPMGEPLYKASLPSKAAPKVV